MQAISTGRAVAAATARGAWSALWSAWTLEAMSPPPEFKRVWARAQEIPGWFDEVTAAAFLTFIVDRRPGRIVEIGSYMGRSAAVLGLSALEIGGGASIVAIDPHSGDRQHLEKLGATHLPSLAAFEHHMLALGLQGIVTPIVASSAEVGAAWSDDVDFVFVDGWHSFDAAFADVVTFGARLTNGGALVVDDVLNYTEVGDAAVQAAREVQLEALGLLSGKLWLGRGPAPPRLQRAFDIDRRRSRLIGAARRRRYDALLRNS
jgi:predicted O-methyltransferase YrrM